MELRPLHQVFALVVLELHLHVALNHRRIAGLVDFRDPQGLCWEGLHGPELKRTPAHGFGQLTEEQLVQKLLLLCIELLLSQCLSVGDVFKLNYDLIGRAEEVGDLFVSSVLRESILEEIINLVIPSLLIINCLL